MADQYKGRMKFGNKTRSQRYRLLLADQSLSVDAPDPAIGNVIIVAANFDGTDTTTIAQTTPIHSSNWTSSATNSNYDNGGVEGSLFGTTRGFVFADAAWAGIVAGTPSFDINTQDFCIEAILEFSNLDADRCIAAISQTNNSRQWELWWDQSANLLKLDIFELVSSSAVTFSFAWTPVVGVNYEIAVGRDTNGIRAYVNGAQIGSEQADSTDIYHSAGVHNFLGYTNNSQHLVHARQYYDAYRFTIGEMHITENYDKRTSANPYPTS